jgi:hypothetical protein
MKKKLGLLIFLCIILSNLFGQSYYSQVRELGGYKLGTAPNSVWFGSQATYRISSSPSFADNVSPEARGLYEIAAYDIKKTKLVIPSVFNIGMMRSLSGEIKETSDKQTAYLQEIVNSSQGLSFGLNPYCEIVKSDKGLTVTLSGLAAAKVNGFQIDTSTVKYLFQGRFGLGVDFSIGSVLPLTLSITPTYTIFDNNTYKEIFDVEKSNVFCWETSVIIPFGAGIGGVVDMNFGKETGFLVALGIIIAAK